VHCHQCRILATLCALGACLSALNCMYAIIKLTTGLKAQFSAVWMCFSLVRRKHHERR
jgi:hypothetical protein